MLLPLPSVLKQDAWLHLWSASIFLTQVKRQKPGLLQCLNLYASFPHQLSIQLIGFFSSPNQDIQPTPVNWTAQLYV